MNHIAEPQFTKPEVFEILISHLKKYPETSLGSLRNTAKQVLLDRKVIGVIEEKSQFMTTRYTRSMNNKDANLINECIYDLLYGRAITPGSGLDGEDLPWVHVSNQDRLNSFLKEL